MSLESVDVMRVVIDELLAMAHYYAVKWQEEREYWLLSIVKEAMLAPVTHPWQESEDEAGHPIFFHTGCANWHDTAL